MGSLHRITGEMFSGKLPFPYDDSPTSTENKIAAGVIVAGLVLAVLWAGDAFGIVPPISTEVQVRYMLQDARVPQPNTRSGQVERSRQIAGCVIEVSYKLTDTVIDPPPSIYQIRQAIISECPNWPTNGRVYRIDPGRAIRGYYH